MDRRDFLAGATAAAGLVAFDRAGGRWLTEAEARGVPGSERLPTLDGSIHFDRATRSASSTDMGRIEHVLPWAVLLPGSVADVQKMVSFCRRHGIKVSQRGQHHSMHGQSLSPGLVIERGVLKEVRRITPTSVVVDAGITFRELLAATLPEGLRPRVMPGYLGLSVGGQLSVGGCPMIGQHGGTVDSVQALQVVTGAGDLVECSPTQNAELFEAMLGGMGQCGVITRVTFQLVPATSTARTWMPTYASAEEMFADMRTLHERGEVDEVYHVAFPPASPVYTYQLTVAKFYNAGEEPDTAHYLRDLHFPAAAAVPQDRAYHDWALFVDTQFAALMVGVQWEALVKPWYDVWLPDATAQEHIMDVLTNLEPDDIGSGGFILIFPHKRSKFKHPFNRIPEGGATDRVMLFDLATTSMLPLRDPAFAARKIARNRRLFEKAKALGGLRYHIGALDFGAPDWEHHFGDTWSEFTRRKARYDPANIMTPGAGIF